MNHPKKSRMRPGQIGAIRESLSLGARLQEDFPQIPELYRKGHSLSQIARRLKISDEYSVEDRTAENAVYYALRGHKGKCDDGKGRNRLFEIPEYEGSISLEEIAILSKKKMKKSGHKMGVIMRDSKRGIHAWSTEQFRANAKKATIYAITARGQKPWSEDEKRIIYELSQNEEYQWRGGRPKLKLIGENLVEQGYPLRTKRAIEYTLGQMRALESKVNE